ncbi:MAG TPA: ABC transporter substrate-binding protein [Noviherbaspirillum sp.]|nr:ABC transporter substrate-binding protein [Noviherbaspirillum sp.]
MLRPLLRSAACLLIVLASASAPAQTLKLVSGENAPFAFTDPATGKITGITTDIAVEAARRAKIAYTLELFPWARAFALASSIPDTCVFPLVRLPERESQFQWVGPLFVNKWVLFARSDFDGTFKTLADAEKYAIGGLLNDGPSVYLVSQGIRVDMVGDHLTNVRKLAAGRIDLWATGLYRGKAIAADVGAKDIKPVLVFKEVDHYIACHPTTQEESIAALNQTVNRMRTDGWLKKITDQYHDRFFK